MNFGESPFTLTYWDFPNEEDDDDIPKLNGHVIRYFDQLTFDSIYSFLGIGGQPVIIIFIDLFQALKNSRSWRERKIKHLRIS